MKRCKICGTTYPQSSTICLLCGISLNKSENKSVTFDKGKHTTSAFVENISVEPEKIKKEEEEQIEKQISKVLIYHPLAKTNELFRFFPSKFKDYSLSTGYAVSDETIEFPKKTEVQLIIVSNYERHASAREIIIKGSNGFIFLHFYDRTSLQIFPKFINEVSMFIENNSGLNKLNGKYFIAFVGLKQEKFSHKEVSPQEKDEYMKKIETLFAMNNQIKGNYFLKFLDNSQDQIINYSQIGELLAQGLQLEIL